MQSVICRGVTWHSSTTHRHRTAQTRGSRCEPRRRRRSGTYWQAVQRPLIPEGQGRPRSVGTPWPRWPLSLASGAWGADLRNSVPKPQPSGDTGPTLAPSAHLHGPGRPCGLQAPRSPRASSQRNRVSVRDRRGGFGTRGTRPWGPCRLLSGHVWVPGHSGRPHCRALPLSGKLGVWKIPISASYYFVAC